MAGHPSADRGSHSESALQQRVLAVFEALAQAEATVHGTSPDSVHFHEVGAMDALVDVVGSVPPCSIWHLCASPARTPAGHGSVKTAHGRLPVPVPAVLELARRHQIPLRHDRDLPPRELTTPTGLALLSVLVDHFCLLSGSRRGDRHWSGPSRPGSSQPAATDPAAVPDPSSGDGSPATDAVDPLPLWQPLVVQKPGSMMRHRRIWLCC